MMRDKQQTSTPTQQKKQQQRFSVVRVAYQQMGKGLTSSLHRSSSSFATKLPQEKLVPQRIMVEGPQLQIRRARHLHHNPFLHVHLYLHLCHNPSEFCCSFHRGEQHPACADHFTCATTHMLSGKKNLTQRCRHSFIMGGGA